MVTADEQQQKVPDFKAAFKQAPKGKKAAGKKTATAAAAGGKLEGVGTGALAAAKAAVGVDVEKMINWKKGAPVPYAFLAETFQVRYVKHLKCLTILWDNATRATAERMRVQVNAV
jgi:hypothetical protein